MIGSLRGDAGAPGRRRRSSSSRWAASGYRVSVTPATAAAIGPTGDRGLLHVHTHVREDAIVLYGFLHDDERRCFEALLGAHGVGPALALAILSVLSPAALSTAVLEEDVDTLCSVPGVGPQDGGPAPHRPEEPARPARPLVRAPAPAAAPATSARAEARPRWPSWATAPEEIRGGAGRSCARTSGWRSCCGCALRELAAR